MDIELKAKEKTGNQLLSHKEVISDILTLAEVIEDLNSKFAAKDHSHEGEFLTIADAGELDDSIDIELLSDRVKIIAREFSRYKNRGFWTRLKDMFT